VSGQLPFTGEDLALLTLIGLLLIAGGLIERRRA
jgi:LPXTG-motif cell wall-anchored protein